MVRIAFQVLVLGAVITSMGCPLDLGTAYLMPVQNDERRLRS